MMKGLLLALLFTVVQALVGCAHYQNAIVADSVTTWVGLQHENIVEANPLFKDASPDAVAVGSAVISVLATEVAKRTMTTNECESFLHLFTSIKYGAAANNLAVIAGASGVVPVAIGLGAAMAIYKMDLARDRCD